MDKEQALEDYRLEKAESGFDMTFNEWYELNGEYYEDSYDAEAHYDSMLAQQELEDFEQADEYFGFAEDVL